MWWSDVISDNSDTYLSLILQQQHKLTGALKTWKVSRHQTCKWLKAPLINPNDSTVTQISASQISRWVPPLIVEQPPPPLRSPTSWHVQPTDGWCSEWVSATKAKNASFPRQEQTVTKQRFITVFITAFCMVTYYLLTSHFLFDLGCS